MKKVYCLLAILCFTAPSFGQLIMNNAIVPAPAATTLVNNYLLGTGVTATNIVYTGAPIARSAFTCAGGCNLGMTNGILLSSGQALTSPGGGTSNFVSSDNGTPGDAMLDAIVFPRLTEDAAVLEFDFIVASDSLKFDYVFASEEYNDYANTNFNDVFAFFISGPGITGTQNIALIPGTATPVSINTVNNGNSGGVATGPCMNCQYFVDNVNGNSVYYDGFTTVLRAQAAVQPCQQYHIKLAVADAGDGVFDSGVFLEGGSFSSLGQINLFANGVPQPDNSTVYACTGTSVTLCLNNATNYNWTTGETTQCITITEQNITPSGVYNAAVFGVGGCFAFTSNVTVVFVTPTATITPSGPVDLCPGGNVTLSANPGNTYLWSNGATTQSINVGTAGTYTVTVSNGPNCSAVSTPVTVTVGSATAQINGVLSLCNGNSTTLTANAGLSYLWSDGTTGPSISPSAAGSYTVTVTQAGGCTASATVNLTVNPNPVPAITGTLSICQGTSTILDAGAGYASYSWNNGALTATNSVNANGTYTVTVTDGFGCTGTTSANVTVNPLPVPAIAGNLTFCIGNNSNLDPGAGYTNYLWNNGTTAQVQNVTASGNYTVTVTDGNGCSASTSVAVVVNPLPVPNITGTFAFCQGSSTLIDAGVGYTNYMWSNGDPTQTTTIIAGNTYTVTVTDANGCVNTDSQLITVNANPVPAITGTLAICQGNNTILTATPGYAAYSWSAGGATPTINVNATGTYGVTVTDVNGCTGTTSANVTVNPLPVPAIAGNLTFCIGNNSNLDPGAGYTNYLWNNGTTAQVQNVTASGSYTVTVTDGNGCSASTSVAVVVNPLPVPNITGTFAFCQGTSTLIDAGAGYTNYMWSNGDPTQTTTIIAGNTYTVTVTDVNGCVNTDSQLITVNANPVPAITGTLAICQGNNTILTATPGYAAYSWSVGGATPTLNVNATGTYGVTVTDVNGCTGTTSANVTVNPLPVPAITGTTAFCQGFNSNLNAGAGFSSYVWSTGDLTQILNVTAAGNYTVTVTNAFGCSASTNTSITVNPLPAPAITGPIAICIGNNATLDAGAGYSTYLWNTGELTQTINTTSGGNYTVTVTTAVGCTGTDGASLTINPLPVPVITGITTICQGTTTILDAGAGYSAYSWSNGANTQTINTGTAGPVTVTVTDLNGCVAPTASNVTVNPLPVPVITGVTEFCQGQSSTLDAGAGYSAYLWSTGATTRTIVVTLAGNYSATVTALTGCAGGDNEMITVHQNPTPVISGVLSICQGNGTTLDAGAGYATYLWSNNATTQTIPVSTTGTFNVTVSSAFGCTGSTTASTVVNALPVPVISGITSICQGTTTSFDAGAGYSAYSWSNGATTQTIAPGVAGIYTVTVTDGNNCSNNTNINLTVNALPVPAITGTTAFCQGDNSNLNAGAGYNNYLWSNGEVTQVINVTTAGNYIVTVTDANGCSANTNTAITVNPNPVPVINGGTGICQGTSTTLNVPGTYSTYLWSTGDLTSSISVNAAGNYGVTVTSAFGCVGSTSTAMIINPLPTPIISGITAVCQGFTTTFDAGAGYSAYSWSNGATTQTISPGVAGSYTVTVTDGNGCQNNTSSSLTVNALPVPSISGDFEFCQGDNSNINANAGYVSYLWSDGTTGQLINVNTAGNYTVTVTDGNGCVASASSLIVVNPLPVPAITGVNEICQGNTTTFNAGNYVSYIWSTGDLTAGMTTGTAGTYTVTVTDLNGCVNNTSETLTVYQLPTAAISGVSTICFGQTTSFNIDFTGAAPFHATYSNGTSTLAYSTGALTASINVSPGTTTTYNLLTISDAHCLGTIGGSAMVTVNPLPEPLISGDLAICDGETTSLAATSGFTSYSWSNSNTQSAITTGTGGIYTVTVIDNNGCSGTSPAVNLIVNAVPVVLFTNDTSLTCSVPQINFTNLSLYVPGSSFEWTFGDGSGAVAANPSHLYFAPGNYPVSLVITTPAGCVSSNSSQVEIMFFPLPEADFVTATPVANVFNGKIDFVDRSANAVSWYWEFGDGDKSIEQNPNHYYNEVGDYHVALTVTNIAGCVDRYEDVIVINPFYIPNAFTPNGDGINDLFYYSGYDLDVSRYNMKIFNRWGQLVFTGQDENDNWNGVTLDGVTAPGGTYVYRLEVKTKGGKEYVFDGQVNLVR